jgi:hypothetical protein
VTVTAAGSGFSATGAILAGGLAAAAAALPQNAPAAPPQPAKQQNCPPVPAHPAGVSVDANIRLVQGKWQEALDASKVNGIEDTGAAQSGVKAWFVNQIRPYGPWDYKNTALPRGKYDEFGNFNFGATGSVLWPEETLLRGAGALKAAVTGGKYGWPWGRYPYGNQPEKQEAIKRGIQYAKNHCGNF